MGTQKKKPLKSNLIQWWPLGGVCFKVISLLSTMWLGLVTWKHNQILGKTILSFWHKNVIVSPSSTQEQTAACQEWGAGTYPGHYRTSAGRGDPANGIQEETHGVWGWGTASGFFLLRAPVTTISGFCTKVSKNSPLNSFDHAILNGASSNFV